MACKGRNIEIKLKPAQETAHLVCSRIIEELVAEHNSDML
jgi:hypothetical protein